MAFMLQEDLFQGCKSIAISSLILKIKIHTQFYTCDILLHNVFIDILFHFPFCLQPITKSIAKDME